jgi:hypothetical protein
MKVGGLSYNSNSLSPTDPKEVDVFALIGLPVGAHGGHVAVGQGRGEGQGEGIGQDASDGAGQDGATGQALGVGQEGQAGHVIEEGCGTGQAGQDGLRSNLEIKYEIPPATSQRANCGALRSVLACQR